MTELRATTPISRRGRPILAGLLAAGLGAAGCGGSTNNASSSGSTPASTPTTASAATTTAQIPPASLAVPAGAMAGFSPSGAPQTATSAQLWSQTSDEADEVTHETARLTSAGFQEGVGQHYKGAAGAAGLSLALVFSSPSGAQAEVRHYLQVDSRYGLHVEGEKVPAIPGSVVVGEGAAGNVLFATGRCFLLVGDQLSTSTTPSQVNAVPVAAATAVYKRVKGVCG